MFSYEDRLRAVQLFIKLDKLIGLTIYQLVYLGGWTLTLVLLAQLSHRLVVTPGSQGQPVP